MRKTIASVLVAMLVLCLSGLAMASPKSEATGLVKKAVIHIKENGKEAALAEFNNANGKFVKGELYVFAYSLQGVIIAHPMNPKLVGKDMLEIKDADGKYFTKEFIATVNGPGKGWVDYRWTNPVSKKIEAKSSYVEKAGDIFVGCGIYK